VGDGSSPALNAIPAGDDHSGHHLDAPLPHDDLHRTIEAFSGGGGDAGTAEDPVGLLGQLFAGDPHGVLGDRGHRIADLAKGYVVERPFLGRTGGPPEPSPAQRVPRRGPDEPVLGIAPQVRWHRPVDLGHAVVEDPAQPVCVRDQLREPGGADRTLGLDDVADHGLDLGHVPTARQRVEGVPAPDDVADERDVPLLQAVAECHQPDRIRRRQLRT